MLRLRQVISIMLVAILMASTTPFSVYKHYCGSFLVSANLYEAHHCGMEVGVEDPSGCEILVPDCCSDHAEFEQGLDELQKVISVDFDFAFAKIDPVRFHFPEIPIDPSSVVSNTFFPPPRPVPIPHFVEFESWLI